MKKTLFTIVIAALALVCTLTFAQGVLPQGDDWKGGPANAWGTPEKFLAFKETLAKYKEGLKLMTDAGLQKAYDDLAAKAKATPGLGDANTQAGAEHRMYVAAVREEMGARKVKAGPATKNR